MRTGRSTALQTAARARRLALAIAISALAFGCVRLPSPHENFKQIIGGHVGEKIADLEARKSGAVDPRYLLSVRELGDGHRELEFKSVGACRYFFTVNDADTIVGWRFTGPESDCVTYP